MDFDIDYLIISFLIFKVLLFIIESFFKIVNSRYIIAYYKLDQINYSCIIKSNCNVLYNYFKLKYYWNLIPQINFGLTF